MLQSYKVLLVSFIASMLGSICGIGGGVVIKPVLDTLGFLNPNTINFLSGFTVLCMSAYSVITGRREPSIENTNMFLIKITIGAVLGGIIGKGLFSIIILSFANLDNVSATQTIVLFILTFGTLMYSLNKNKIKTHHIKNSLAIVMVGICLGFFSAFLGIGGGPFNLIFLSFFFSMEMKKAAYHSLFIIMFSQFTSLCLTIISRQTPEFDNKMLIGMALTGLVGAIIGRKLNAKIDSKSVDLLFHFMIVMIMIICFKNIWIIYY